MNNTSVLLFQVRVRPRLVLEGERNYHVKNIHYLLGWVTRDASMPGTVWFILAVLA